MFIRHHILILLFGILLGGCADKPTVDIVDEISQRMPGEFPNIVYPTDNAYTPERWELGKMLFYDNRLSIDSSISCASCHKSELAFSDDVATSLGVKQRPGTRNSPSIANVAYHPYYTREGGVPTLEQQVLVPVQEHNEFDFNILSAGKRLAKDSLYNEMSMRAYNRPMDFFVITRALANFERELLSQNSKFDRYRKNSTALSQAEVDGMTVFYSDKGGCYQCHSGPNFTNYSFQNTGIYETYSDIGRMRLTQKEKDLSVFKVPSLRNIELTGPYMHDGSFNTLEEVIEHYNTGGKNHANKSTLIKPLHLTEDEKNHLLQFLKTLTDHEFVANEKYKNK